MQERLAPKQIQKVLKEDRGKNVMIYGPVSSRRTWQQKEQYAQWNFLCFIVPLSWNQGYLGYSYVYITLDRSKDEWKIIKEFVIDRILNEQ